MGIGYVLRNDLQAGGESECLGTVLSAGQGFGYLAGGVEDAAEHATRALLLSGWGISDRKQK